LRGKSTIKNYVAQQKTLKFIHFLTFSYRTGQNRGAVDPSEALFQGIGAVGADAYGKVAGVAVAYTHLRAHETPEHLVCRLLVEKKKL